MLRTSSGPISVLMGYCDQLGEYYYFLMYFLQLTCLIVIPDHTEVKLLRESVRALPDSRPCPTSSHFSGPHTYQDSNSLLK